MVEIELLDREIQILTINRRRILKALSSRPSNTNNLRTNDRESWHCMRYHLKILETFGFVTSQKQEIPAVNNKDKKYTRIYTITAKGHTALQRFGE